MIDLSTRIEDRSARIAVIGLGYVGLPLLRTFHDAGYPVLGVDVDPEKIRMLGEGQMYLKHLGDDYVQPMVTSGRLEITTDFSRLRDADAIIICVPTPLDAHLQPDLSYVEITTRAVAPTLRTGQLIVLESTTYPGTTRGVMLPILEKAAADKGLEHGRDYFVAYSPEREDPGSKSHSTSTIPKLVGGLDARSGELAASLYEKAVEKVIPVRSAEVAESAKLLENIYRAVNIALVNEMKVVLTDLGIDIWEVVDAAATKPFGFQAFYPGPGLGGHCIPIDPYYMTYKAREVGRACQFIELAGEVNRHMPNYVVERTMRALNEHGKAVKGSKILVVGLAYKPDVDDVRESPSFELIEHLQALGADVSYHDPHVAATHKMREHDLQMQSVPLTSETLAEIDCVLIATHHKACDWSLIADRAQLVVDTRGVMRRYAETLGNRLVGA